MNPAEPGWITSAHRGAAQRLRIDSVTAEVLRAFEAAAVQSLLLKGRSFVPWLYGEAESRLYTDCDLLVRPDDHAMATAVLASLGFAPELEETEMPVWWREHGVAWTRSEDLASVDLHKTLPGVGVDERTLWGRLRTDSETLTVGGQEARVLSIPGRALHLALHAAQHGTGGGPVVEELELAAVRADPQTWRASAALAESLEAAAALGIGLRLTPSGRRIANELGLPSVQAGELALRAGSAPSAALTLVRLRGAGGWRARAAIVRHKLVPPPTYMRKWFPRARRGRRWLALAYLWRPFWLLGQLPAARRASRRA